MKTFITAASAALILGGAVAGLAQPAAVQHGGGHGGHWGGYRGYRGGWGGGRGWYGDRGWGGYRGYYGDGGWGWGAFGLGLGLSALGAYAGAPGYYGGPGYYGAPGYYGGCPQAWRWDPYSGRYVLAPAC